MELHTYPLLTRSEVAPLLPPTARNVLDIGCGPGGFGITLRKRYPQARLVGVEPEPGQAEQAREYFNEIYEGFFPEAVPAGVERFDVIVMNDVIEHVVDPWSLLDAVRGHLTDDGCVVAAIPNVRHLPVSANLLFRGRWDYADAGILDRTHVRFFTRKSISELFPDCGYTIERMTGLGTPWSHHRRFKPLKLVPPRFRDTLYQHFGVVARQAKRRAPSPDFRSS